MSLRVNTMRQCISKLVYIAYSFSTDLVLYMAQEELYNSPMLALALDSVVQVCCSMLTSLITLLNLP